MQRDHASDIAAIIRHPSFKAAVEKLDADHDRIVEDIVTLTEIPAPPFKEDRRAAAYLEKGGLKEAAYWTRLAADAIAEKTRGH